MMLKKIIKEIGYTIGNLLKPYNKLFYTYGELHMYINDRVTKLKKDVSNGTISTYVTQLSPIVITGGTFSLRSVFIISLICIIIYFIYSFKIFKKYKQVIYNDIKFNSNNNKLDAKKWLNLEEQFC